MGCLAQRPPPMMQAAIDAEANRECDNSTQDDNCREQIPERGGATSPRSPGSPSPFPRTIRAPRCHDRSPIPARSCRPWPLRQHRSTTDSGQRAHACLSAESSPADHVRDETRSRCRHARRRSTWRTRAHGAPVRLEGSYCGPPQSPPSAGRWTTQPSREQPHDDDLASRCERGPLQTLSSYVLMLRHPPSLSH